MSPSATKLAWTDTSVSQVQISFTWSLQNVSRLLSNRRNSPGLRVIRSPNFFSDADEDTQWYLELHPRGRDDHSTDHVSLFITLDCSTQTEVLASYKLTVVTAGGTSAHQFREESVRFNEGDTRGKEQFVLRSFLLDKSKNLCPNDTLTVDCHLSATRVIHSSRRPTKSTTDKEAPEIHLASDMSSLLGDVRFSDVILQVRGREFPAHRAILAARSPVFSLLVDKGADQHHHSRVCEQQRIEIKDVDPEVFQQTLKYVYGGHVDQLDSMAAPLLAVADKYELIHLKNMCQDYLIDNLNSSDAGSLGSLYMLADLHSADHLKSQTLKLMQQQHGGLATLLNNKH